MTPRDEAIQRVRTSITHHSVNVAHLLMAYDEALAERDKLHAVLALVAGNLAAWVGKRVDAPESAQEHMDEAMHALVRFRPEGGYGEAASKLRLEMWHGEVYAERDEARKEREEYRAVVARQVEDKRRLLAERDAARAELLCKGCGGTVGDHLAPDQGGCPANFVIGGVPMVPAHLVDAARAELAAIRGRDAKPFDWDGVPTVEEWIEENLKEREPRCGSAMVELHPDEVVADRGESRRVAGWLKDLLAENAKARAELGRVREQLDRMIAVSVKVTNTSPRSCSSDPRDLDHYDACGDLAQAFMDIVMQRAIAAAQPQGGA